MLELRAKVRRICAETAWAGGRSPERVPDDWLWAEFWTRYYTDREPRHTWVAESPTLGVCGYLTGTLDAQGVARYLPRLRLGGLFALHDTFVFDALGLVVLALAHSGRVEMLSMSSHRRHAHPARSPGVSLFRKIAPIAPGELRFPDLGDAAGGEQHGLVDAAAIATRTGALFADRRYHAQRLGQEAREATSPALLEPQPPTPC